MRIARWAMLLLVVGCSKAEPIPNGRLAVGTKVSLVADEKDWEGRPFTGCLVDTGGLLNPLVQVEGGDPATVIEDSDGHDHDPYRKVMVYLTGGAQKGVTGSVERKYCIPVPPTR
jgi:hypothetical protein